MSDINLYTVIRMDPSYYDLLPVYLKCYSGGVRRCDLTPHYINCMPLMSKFTYVNMLTFVALERVVVEVKYLKKQLFACLIFTNISIYVIGY